MCQVCSSHKQCALYALILRNPALQKTGWQDSDALQLPVHSLFTKSEPLKAKGYDLRGSPSRILSLQQICLLSCKL
jgi:hypothetical protein